MAASMVAIKIRDPRKQFVAVAIGASVVRLGFGSEADAGAPCAGTSQLCSPRSVTALAYFLRRLRAIVLGSTGEKDVASDLDASPVVFGSVCLLSAWLGGDSVPERGLDFALGNGGCSMSSQFWELPQSTGSPLGRIGHPWCVPAPELACGNGPGGLIGVSKRYWRSEG